MKNVMNKPLCLVDEKELTLSQGRAPINIAKGAINPGALDKWICKHCDRIYFQEEDGNLTWTGGPKMPDLENR
jgi:hypothetical protein